MQRLGQMYVGAENRPPQRRRQLVEYPGVPPPLPESNLGAHHFTHHPSPLTGSIYTACCPLRLHCPCVKRSEAVKSLS